MTASERAIERLRVALGDRPWILVYDRNHPDVGGSCYVVDYGNARGSRERHSLIGLLRVGETIVKRGRPVAPDDGGGVA